MISFAKAASSKRGLCRRVAVASCAHLLFSVLSTALNELGTRSMSDQMRRPLLLCERTEA
jgi:hypothetical protein